MKPDRDIARVVAARFISRTGGEAAFFIGIWGMAAYRFRSSPGELALLMGTLVLSSMLGTLAAGVLIDRYDPKRILIAAEAVFVPVALLFMFARSMTELTGLAALLGFSGAPVMTAAASIAPFLVEGRERLQKVNAWMEGAGSLSLVLGPGAGALIARLASVEWVFAFDAFTSLVAVALLAAVRIRRPETAQVRGRGALSELMSGVTFTYRHRPLRYYVLMGSAAWLGFGAFGALEPLFFRDVLETGVETIGWINVLFGLGLIAGAALLARLPKGLISARGLAGVSVLMGFGALLYAGTDDVRVVAAGAIIWGTVIGASEPLLRTLIQADSPDEFVGRVAGTSRVHQAGGELLPLAFAPTLAALFGVQVVLVGGGFLLSLVAAASWFEARAVDRQVEQRRALPTGLITADEPVSPNP